VVGELTNMVSYKKCGPVVVITITRPDFQNTINTSVVAQFADIRNRTFGSREINAIIITGAGDKAFCSGTDPEEFCSYPKGIERLERFSISSIVSQMDRPTIAAINGDACGQGLELALACDLRICSIHARFGMAQIMDGEIPWDGGTQRLARLIGRGKAMEMILTGETIEAEEAWRIGLINQVVPHEKLPSAAMEIAQKIGSNAPIALGYAKEAVYKGMDMTLDQGLRLEADLYFLLQTTRDRTEGIRAFKEKRSPRFEGK
jgi:enoyl-CoA hydratase/carnithine racemase